MAFSRTNRVSRYRSDSVLDFIGAKDGGGGDSWRYKTRKATLKLAVCNTGLCIYGYFSTVMKKKNFISP